jgi:transposase-like protein
LGAELVQHLAGSAQAKQRLSVVLQTLAGERTVAQACAELGIGESRFHALRNQVLQQTLDALEPKPLGRPTAAPEDARLARLQQEIRSLTVDLRAAQVREELAMMLPRVLHPDPRGRRAKKKPR